MLDIVASSHFTQFQGKLINQTWENGKKLMDTAKKTVTDDAKTDSEQLVQKMQKLQVIWSEIK